MSKPKVLRILNRFNIGGPPHMGRAINPIKDYKAYREIEDLILDFKPDIVHTHASKAGALGRLAADRNKVKHIVHTFHGHVFHGYFPKWKTNFPAINPPLFL